MPAKETAQIQYPPVKKDECSRRGVSQTRDFHRRRLPRSVTSEALSRNTLSLLGTDTGKGFGREHMVFERFLLQVSLAEGGAEKALGGPAIWRVENEREYHARPSSMNDYKNYTFLRLAG
jgi:hypothetical protein